MFDKAVVCWFGRMRMASITKRYKLNGILDKPQRKEAERNEIQPHGTWQMAKKPYNIGKPERNPSQA